MRTAIGRGDEADLSADTAHHIPVSVGSDQIVAGRTVVDKILMGIGPPDIIQAPAGVGFGDAWDPGSNRPVGDGVDQFPEAELAQAHDDVIDGVVVEKCGVARGMMAAHHDQGIAVAFDLPCQSHNGVGFTGHAGETDQVGFKLLEGLFQNVRSHFQVGNGDLMADPDCRR